MDEKLKQLIETINNPVTPRPIPSGAAYYRQVHLTHIDKKKHIPSPSCFKYTPENEDDGLSVDWAELTTPELSLALLGRTYKLNSEIFKSPAEFAIYRINGSFLNSLEDVPRVRHHPNFFGDPPPKGRPNNPSHTVIIYQEPDDLEIRVKLQNHARPVDVNRGLVAEIGAGLAEKEL